MKAQFRLSIIRNKKFTNSQFNTPLKETKQLDGDEYDISSFNILYKII
jgi:hypothetical protein